MGTNCIEPMMAGKSSIGVERIQQLESRGRAVHHGRGRFVMNGGDGGLSILAPLDSLHPQWVMIDLGAKVEVNATGILPACGPGFVFSRAHERCAVHLCHETTGRQQSAARRWSRA
jgi:hypothetical protein